MSRFNLHLVKGWQMIIFSYWPDTQDGRIIIGSGSGD